MPVVSSLSPRVMVPNVLAGFVKYVDSSLNLDAVLPAKRPRGRPKTTQSIHYNDNCVLLLIIYFLFYSVVAMLSDSCDEQLDTSVTNVALPSNFDAVSPGQLTNVLSKTFIRSPEQSGICVKRGPGRPRKIQSNAYLTN